MVRAASQSRSCGSRAGAAPGYKILTRSPRLLAPSRTHSSPAGDRRTDTGQAVVYLPESTIHGISRFRKRLRKEVTVDVGGRAEQRVSHDLLNDLEWHPFRNKQADRRVARDIERSPFKPAWARSPCQMRNTLHGSSGVPPVETNTRQESIQRPAVAMRSKLCWSRCTRSASTTEWGDARGRLLAVFGPLKISFPATR
jgi:hypothetical protein